jgi:hypothetical protein
LRNKNGLTSRVRLDKVWYWCIHNIWNEMVVYLATSDMWTCWIFSTFCEHADDLSTRRVTQDEREKESVLNSKSSRSRVESVEANKFGGHGYHIWMRWSIIWSHQTCKVNFFFHSFCGLADNCEIKFAKKLSLLLFFLNYSTFLIWKLLNRVISSSVFNILKFGSIRTTLWYLDKVTKYFDSNFSYKHWNLYTRDFHFFSSTKHKKK